MAKTTTSEDRIADLEAEVKELRDEIRSLRSTRERMKRDTEESSRRIDEALARVTHELYDNGQRKFRVGITGENTMTRIVGSFDNLHAVESYKRHFGITGIDTFMKNGKATKEFIVEEITDHDAAFAEFVAIAKKWRIQLQLVGIDMSAPAPVSA